MRGSLGSVETGDPRSGMDAETMDAAQHNRFPIVASQSRRSDRMGMALGLAIALLLGGATLLAMQGSRTHPAPSAPPVQPPAPAYAPPQPMLAAPMAPQASVPLRPALAAPMPAPAAPMMLPPPRPALLPGLQAQAPAVIFDNSPAPTILAAPAPVAKGASATNLTSEEQFAARLKGDDDNATATRMASPATTIAEGTLMSAVLETAVNSDTPGYVRAVISRDVRSFDNSAILIPRGSHVIGQYKSGLVPGQSRAFIVWTRLLRPDGVSIALGSPATDYAGENGLTGKVHGHFVKRYGAAILLSLIGATGQALGGGGTSLVIAGPASTLSSGVQTNANIPPTVQVRAGTPMRIFTAHDLDFSGVVEGK